MSFISENDNLPEKVIVDLDQHVFMLYPRQTILVTSRHEDTINIISVAWSTALSQRPPLHGIVLSPKRLSHDLIKKSRKFIINVPKRDLINEIVACGRSTGRVTNKFKQCGLSSLPPLALGDDGPPRIGECPVHIECLVKDMLDIGDHTLFIGEVVACSADAELVKNGIFQPNMFEIPYHLGGHQFTFNSKKIYSF
ncbi:MAG: flavin reductase family protein [Promethearchaeota archaeon]